MATHIKVVGVLHIVMGAFGLLIGLAFLVFFGGLASFVGVTDHTNNSLLAIPILGSIGAFLFILISVLSLPGIIAGIGLVQFRPWGRVLGIILSILHLMNVPFGTALGAYGLWALLSPEGEALFRRDPVPAVPRY